MGRIKVLSWENKGSVVGRIKVLSWENKGSVVGRINILSVHQNRNVQLEGCSLHNVIRLPFVKMSMREPLFFLRHNFYSSHDRTFILPTTEPLFPRQNLYSSHDNIFIRPTTEPLFFPRQNLYSSHDRTFILPTTVGITRLLDKECIFISLNISKTIVSNFDFSLQPHSKFCNSIVISGTVADLEILSWGGQILIYFLIVVLCYYYSGVELTETSTATSTARET